MEYIAEIIVEIVLELIFGFGTDRKTSKWIRYPLLVIAISCCLAIIGFFVWTGIEEFETSRGRSIISWILAIFLTALMAIGFVDSSKKLKKKLNKK